MEAKATHFYAVTAHGAPARRASGPDADRDPLLRVRSREPSRRRLPFPASLVV